MTFPQTILGVRVELFYDGVWNDITSRVRTADGGVVSITRGRPDESNQPPPSSVQLAVNNRDGRFSPRNPSSPLFGKIGRNTPIRISVDDGKSYAQVTQPNGTTIGTCSFSTPDSVATSITGDIDIRFDADLVSWRDDMTLYGKWTKAGSQAAYELDIRFGGTLQFFWTTDGITRLTAGSVPVPVTNGRLAVRATMDVNDGSGNHVVTFYTSDSISGTWTQLGSPTTIAGTTSIINTTSPSYVLDPPDDDFGSVIHGRVYAAEVRNGIAGTVVASPTFTNLAGGVTSLVDAQGNTWSLNSSLGSLAVVDADPRFVGEVTSWPQMWDTSGTDIWVPLEVSDITRRLGQGAPALQSPLRVALVKEPALRAYWTLEDGSDATNGASALVGGSPLVVTPGPSGKPQFASDSSYIASMPIAQFNSARLSGPIKAYTSTGAIQVRALIHIPSGGTVDGSSIFRLYNAGTSGIWNLTYGTGGTLSLTARQINPDGSDTPIAGGVFGPVGFLIDGDLAYVSMELQNSGANVNWKMSTIIPGQGFALASSGTLNSFQIGRATKLTMNNGLSMLDVGVGHVSVESAITDLFAVGGGPLSAYAGETAQTRMIRLCTAQGVSFQGGGFNAGSTLLGPQGTGAFLALMQEAATVDGGVLYTPKDWLALAYRPAGGLYAQPADVTLDYSLHQMDTLQPTEDDQRLRNDITVSRVNGSSFRAVDTDSPLSVNAPPDGVGTYDDSISLNVFSDAQLADQAGWRLRLGTVDEARYPTINLNMASPAIATNAALSALIPALDVGARLVVINPPAWLPPDPISQVIQGYTEVLAQYTRTLALNCTPSVSNDTAGIWGPSYQLSRYSSDGSTLNTSATPTAASISVATVDGPLWSHADGDFDIRIGGERMTVTNVTGTSSPQTFTVTRSVNGVVKTQTSGQVVELYAPAYYVL